MKRILSILTFLLLLSWNSIYAQKGLNIEPVFSGEYNDKEQAVVIYLKGKKLKPYHLDIFYSVSIQDSQDDVLKFEKAVLADGRNASNSEIIKSGNKTLACYYQLPPDKKMVRTVLFYSGKKVRHRQPLFIWKEIPNSIRSSTSS